MNKNIPLTAIVISLAFATTAPANESLPEPSVMLYWTVPIGDTAAPRYGMRLDSLPEPLPSGALGLPFFQADPPLLNFEMGNHGGKTWKFSDPGAAPELDH